MVYSLDKKNFVKRVQELLEIETNLNKKERKNKLLGYIRNQWKNIENYILNKDKYSLGCSAEGSVSHILASRMSSRPQAWSRIGLESLTKLRIAVLNGATEKDLIVSLESGKNNKNEKIEEKEKNLQSYQKYLIQ